MELKKGWWLTTSTGKNWVVYQPQERGKLYKEFTAKNCDEAKAIALQIIKDFENAKSETTTRIIKPTKSQRHNSL